ncbi:MAG: LysR family transcriptional regulator [Peptococcaceae bacterium]|nr:LysR family transcriptional regulator [Peptococcaceae bacterium]
MELRTLRYFLEIAREENMTKAAERLHVSQSALSRQIKGLEEELGKRLFIRHSFRIELTPEGHLLRKRAEDILQMVDKTTEEFQSLDNDLRGDIFIGCAESEATKRLATLLFDLHNLHPDIHYHLKSGNTADIAGDLDKGLLDFAVIANPVDLTKYNFLTIPTRDRWGAILPREHPLAEKEAISATDLLGEPLVLSVQSITDDYPKFFGDLQERLNVVATFNLPYNGAVLVRAGLGIMLCFDHLIDTGASSGLCFRPLTPQLESEGHVIWKKYQVFSPVAQALLDLMKDAFI